MQAQYDLFIFPYDTHGKYNVLQGHRRFLLIFIQMSIPNLNCVTLPLFCEIYNPPSVPTLDITLFAMVTKPYVYKL